MGLIVYGMGRFSGKVTVHGIYYVYDTTDLSIEVAYGSSIKDLARVKRGVFDNIETQFKLTEPKEVLKEGVYISAEDLIVVVHEDLSYNIWWYGFECDRLFYKAEDGSLRAYESNKYPIGVYKGNIVTIYGDFAIPLVPGKYRRPIPVSKEKFLKRYT